MAQVDESIAVTVGQRLQENAAYDAEDRGVGADPQSERKHHGDREPRGAREGADGVAEVSQHGCCGCWFWLPSLMRRTTRLVFDRLGVSSVSNYGRAENLAHALGGGERVCNEITTP